MTDLERRAWSAAGRTLRPVACNLCGADDGRPLAIENGLHVVRCRRCGLVYVTPQPGPRDLQSFYEEYYPEHSEEGWRRIMAPVFVRDAERLEAIAPERGRLLDVGTGFGHFLEVLRERGWTVEGLEGSARARARLEARGIVAHAGFLPEADLPADRYDVITASSVLEHAADPLAFLRRARELLRPGGLLFVRVPNVQLLGVFFQAARFRERRWMQRLLGAVRREIMDAENLFHVIDPPAHLFGFDARTLADALRRAGFAAPRVEGDPMQSRGTALNRWIDGSVFAGARIVSALSGGRIELSPNLSAFCRR